MGDVEAYHVEISPAAIASAAAMRDADAAPAAVVFAAPTYSKICAAALATDARRCTRMRMMQALHQLRVARASRHKRHFLSFV
jgi:hypothetical protein